MPYLQFITHQTDRYSYADSARLALEGGCRWIQLRMKGSSPDEILRTGTEIQQLCRRYGATFIIDDQVEIARELKADGVHLGKKDMPVAEARSLLGREYIIGGTANTFEDVAEHHRAGADYIGCGPFRFTTTKQGLAPLLGLEGYRRILGEMQRQGIPVPVIAIGGITYNDITDILATGVQGIALSGTILQAADPVAETRRLLQRLSSPTHHS